MHVRAHITKQHYQPCMEKQSSHYMPKQHDLTDCWQQQLTQVN